MDNHTKIEIGVGVVGIAVTLWAILSRGSGASSVQTLPSSSGVALPPPIDLGGGSLDSSAGGLLGDGSGTGGGGASGGNGGLTGGLGPSGNETTTGVPDGAVYVGNGIYASNGLAYIGPNKGPAANSSGSSVTANTAQFSAGPTPLGNSGGAGAPPPTIQAESFPNPAGKTTVLDSIAAASPNRLALPTRPTDGSAVFGAPAAGGITPAQSLPVVPAGTSFGPARPTPAPALAPVPTYPVAVANSGQGYTPPPAPVQATPQVGPNSGVTTASSGFGAPGSKPPVVTRSNVITAPPR